MFPVQISLETPEGAPTAQIQAERGGTNHQMHGRGVLLVLKGGHGTACSCINPELLLL